MNVGYTRNIKDIDIKCPLCGGDVYVNKYQTDYKCMNESCLLHNHKASELIGKINSVLYNIGGDL